MFHFRQSSLGYPASCHESCGIWKKRAENEVKMTFATVADWANSDYVPVSQSGENTVALDIWSLKSCFKEQLSVKRRKGFFCLSLARRATFSFFLVKILLVFWGDSRWVSSGLSKYHLQTTWTTIQSHSFWEIHHIGNTECLYSEISNTED